ncbi:MAG: NAD-dependent epimerase/dehydratase family protein [Rhodomicrobiaceae bacterium]
MSKNETILLTGATGFLGSKILETLLAENYKVIILKRQTSDTHRIQHLLDQVQSYDVDTCSAELPFNEQEIDVVIHTACNYGKNNTPMNQIIESNVLFGIKILETAIKFEIKTFINIDTLLPKDLNFYSLSKSQFVDYLKLLTHKIQIINLKIEYMYGPNDNTNQFIPWMFSQLRSETPLIKLTKGTQYRDFIYIDDVASACLTTLKKAKTMAQYNKLEVGTGQSITIKDFLQKFIHIYELRFGKIHSHLAFGELPFRKGELMRCDVNNKSLIELGWSPKIKLEEGLKNLIDEIT